MADNYVVFVEGLENTRFTEDTKRSIVTAAYRAINRTSAKARTWADEEIRRQVAFPASYLKPSAGRLTVSKKAARDSLEGRVRGQHRPTSLARFIVGSPPKRGGGVRVEVKPGIAKFMRRAFLVKLPGGTETKFNAGLAIRLRPGEKLENKRQARRLASGLYLLYGPSVDQVFRTVSEDISPASADYLEREFNRLLEL